MESPEGGAGPERWAGPHLGLMHPQGTCILILPQQSLLLGFWASARRAGLQNSGAGISHLQGPVGFSGTELTFSSPSSVCVSSDSFSLVSKLRGRRKRCYVLVPLNPGVLRERLAVTHSRSGGDGARGVNFLELLPIREHILVRVAHMTCDSVCSTCMTQGVEQPCELGLPS